MKRSIRHLVLFLLLACAGVAPASGAGGGKWNLLQRSIGVSAMHMQLLHNDRVIIFDRTDFGQSNLSLPDGRCRRNPRERVLPVDCTAHSAEYDVVSNTFRPLTVFTDTWCSSGTVAPDGTLVQTGGWNDGYRNARTMAACGGDDDDKSCDWSETQDALAANRWYATNQILPDGRAFIVGGRRQFSYEFYPKADASDTSVMQMPFLVQTRDPEENNLYPFVHLNIDGNLFIFAKNRAILFDYKKNKIVRTYPVLAGGDPRNYPSSGSSVLLPLKPNPTEAEVLVCGGAPAGSYNSTKVGTFVPALVTCGRIKITEAAPSWVIETMPSPRVMGDMILLPNGAELAIINGATDGTAGWESAKTPAYAPVIYRPDHSPGDRFEVQSPTGIARLYHSSVVLLRDGRLLVGGSNPHVYYNFSNVQFPTELSLEAFSPEYLDPSNDALRPRILHPWPTDAPASVTYGATMTLQFSVPEAASTRRRRGGGGANDLGVVSVTMVAPSFTTHSFAMNQRLLFLEVTKTAAVPNLAGAYEASVTMPATAVLAPPGYYMVFVVNGHIPSEGIWIHIQRQQRGGV
ncbi:aldehyde oxidase GLOX-like [Phragmites australis]|uniref:aldehyde oxidase GLOX-like n=1 Tax=Phragmites australis TaxID=29695 RepID=UPI002D77816B|nr:aldehyde oxidase GLOX-like [Phragmites australis]